MFWDCVQPDPPHQPQEAVSRQDCKCYSLLSWPWLTGVWRRVKQASLMSEKLRSEKFFISKCKEGDHINLKLWVDCRACAAFSDPGSQHDHCPLSRKRNESILWGESRGDWRWTDNRIKDCQIWALKGERSKLSPLICGGQSRHEQPP